MKFDASLKNVPRASSYVCNTSSNVDLLTSMILVTFKFFCDSPAFSSLASVSTMTVPSSILISLTRSRPIFFPRLPRSNVNCLFSLLSLSILSSYSFTTSVIAPLFPSSPGIKSLRTSSSLSYAVITFSNVLPSFFIISGTIKLSSISWSQLSFNFSVSLSPTFSTAFKRLIPIVFSKFSSLLTRLLFLFSKPSITSSFFVICFEINSSLLSESVSVRTSSCFSYSRRMFSIVFPSSFMRDSAFKTRRGKSVPNFISLLLFLSSGWPLMSLTSFLSSASKSCFWLSPSSVITLSSTLDDVSVGAK